MIVKNSVLAMQSAVRTMIVTGARARIRTTIKTMTRARIRTTTMIGTMAMIRTTMMMVMARRAGPPAHRQATVGAWKKAAP
jgi:hypothetical protein